MTSYGGDDRLVKFALLQKLPNLFRRFIPVHDRHIAIHQNQFVLTGFQAIIGDVILDSLQSLLAIYGFIANFVHVELDVVFQNDFECGQIVVFVINKKYPRISLLDIFNLFAHL